MAPCPDLQLSAHVNSLLSYDLQAKSKEAVKETAPEPEKAIQEDTSMEVDAGIEAGVARLYRHFALLM